jgi:hypothetical protein
LKIAPLRGALPLLRLAIYDPVDPVAVAKAINRDLEYFTVTMSNVKLVEEFPAEDYADLLDQDDHYLMWPVGDSANYSEKVDCLAFGGLTRDEVETIARTVLHAPERELEAKTWTPNGSTTDRGVIYLRLPSWKRKTVDSTKADYQDDSDLADSDYWLWD